MSLAFNEIMIRIVRDYKNLRKRIYRRSAATSAIYKKMGINRLALRNADDTKLYAVGNLIINDIEDYLTKREKIATVHCGVEEFLQHVKRTISEYKMEGKKVVHTQRKISCDILEAIQLVTLPTQKLTMEVMDKINLCLGAIMQNGTSEQIEILKTAFRQNKNRLEESYKKFGKFLFGFSEAETQKASINQDTMNE